MTDMPTGRIDPGERKAWLCIVLAGLNLAFGFQQQDITSIGSFILALALAICALMTPSKKDKA